MPIFLRLWETSSEPHALTSHPSGSPVARKDRSEDLETSSAALNVPEGKSYWEFGTDQDYKAKATREFARVSGLVPEEERKVCTLVIVTPWTWDSSDPHNKLEDWEEQRQTEHAWKQVNLLDGLKLQAWLEVCPAAAAWHARNTVKLLPQDGARSTDEFWEFFRHHFRPPLTEEVLLCERESQSEELLQHLMGAPDRLSFSADLPDEVIAFAIAAIRKARPCGRI